MLGTAKALQHAPAPGDAKSFCILYDADRLGQVSEADLHAYVARELAPPEPVQAAERESACACRFVRLAVSLTASS